MCSCAGDSANEWFGFGVFLTLSSQPTFLSEASSEILTHGLNLDTSADTAVNALSSLLTYLSIYLQENTHQAFTD